jgi:exopolysaccharide production protein ExoY
MQNVDFERFRCINGSGRDEDKVTDAASGRSRSKNGSCNSTYGYAKIIIDIALSMIGVVVLFPLIIMVSILLFLVQGRPIFIKSWRIGKRGALFPCIKFRTMVNNGDEVIARYLETNPDAHAEWTTTRKLKSDPRVTPMGSVLRASSVDEIPQLFNILRGEMSLVGPRPIVPSEAEMYGAHISDYMKVRPGLTGLWQVSGRSDTSYAQRVQLDVKYVAEHNLMNDLVIMVKTVPAVLRAHGSY